MVCTISYSTCSRGGTSKSAGSSRPRLPPVLVDELLPLLLQEGLHLAGHWDGLVEIAGIVFLPVEALSVAVEPILLAAAARAWALRVSFLRVTKTSHRAGGPRTGDVVGRSLMPAPWSSPPQAPPCSRPGSATSSLSSGVRPPEEENGSRLGLAHQHKVLQKEDE
jgi:hypothetical protein